MKLICAPLSHSLLDSGSADLKIVLYGHPDRRGQGSVGAAIADSVRRAKLLPEPRAWDLLTIALSIVAADTLVSRDKTPDGWTREIEITIAVTDPAFWTTQSALVEALARFMTNDLWTIQYDGGGASALRPRKIIRSSEDCVALLSGGLDSLVGVADLVFKHSRRPFVVSQIAVGDRQNQRRFATLLGGLRHLQLNHNAAGPGSHERSQRARSLAFFSYGVLAATTLQRYKAGEAVTLYVCENGYISINPPLTGGRLGSLSTRTTHPVLLQLLQRLLDAAGLRVQIENPYQFKTKGEMLRECGKQEMLKKYGHTSTSCGRFARNGYRHCGRCVPCLIRRAAFRAWGVPDRTDYVYKNLGRDDDDHARFDDVRSARMAVAQVASEGLDAWLGGALSSTLLGDVTEYRSVVERGLAELENLLRQMGVR